VAFEAYKNNIEWNDAEMLGELAKNLKIQFSRNEIYLDGERITEAVRSEEMSSGASQVATHPQVRNALLDLQRSFRKAPGLVVDGRDMGSVIFKDAVLKIFLTASVQIRAERRYKQLINKGLNANYAQILADLQSRDERDSWRSAAPLIQTADALLLETSKCSIEEAVKLVLNAYQISNKKP
jgi:cytidylate kinase